MKKFSLPVRVYIEDTDAGGIVYYVNYLKYMERGRTELLRSLGYAKAAIFQEGILLVVRSAQVDYLQAARLDDELMVTSRFLKVANTHLVFHQEVCRQQHVLCRAEIKIACVTEEKPMRPVAMPKQLTTQLRQLVEPQHTSS
ncbi:MAG: tol-pal system-associated acyl-CoA thioesterase [Cellvibrionaceae bacterium]|nr:tol-pal system-associated acyl-CoA thioesterase [Cellvibrionaceae bacterium]